MQQLIRLRLTRGMGVLAAAVLLSASGLAAQTGTIAGRVLDAQTGQPIPAAQVFIGELDIGSLTQQSGAYLLLNVPVGSRTVTVQRIGYRQETQNVTVASGQTMALEFRLTEEALRLDEVIVTGTAGGTQRRAIGNTVESVGVSDVVQQVAITSMQELLTGRSQGLRFSRLSGNVGTGSPVSIRGVGSFDQGRNQPLIFVDGVRVNNDEEAGPTLGSGGNVNVLDDFNPEDIESIEIIKGPAAASLYGTEASAGVIQIITKKGREGSPEFNISLRQGTNYMPDPAGRLGTMYTCPTDNSPGPVACQTEADLETYNMYDEGTRYIAEGYFPWPTENLYSGGRSQGYNLDVRGGTNAIRYFLSGNYDDEAGIIYYNTDETARLRGNVGVVFSDKFSLDLSTGYVDGSTRFAAPTVSDGGVYQDLLWSNGYYLDRINPFDGSGPGAQAANPRLGGFQEHLPTDVEKIQATRDYSRFTGSATVNFTTGARDFGSTSATLTSRLVVGLDKGWDVNRNLFPLQDKTAVPSNMTAFASSWSSVYSETDNGEMTYSQPVSTNQSFDYSATLALDIADTWTLNTAFGVQFYSNRRENFTNHGQGFASPLSTTINQITQANIVTSYSDIENRSLGFFVQEEVGWNDRLFITGAVRFDDNSTFGTNAPAQKYPKISGTWVLSEESFWNFESVSSLRVRGAWGKAGRQPSALSGQNIYVAIPGPGGTPAIRPSAPGNDLVEPEVSTELEVGFDLGLFNDRVSGAFTHYWRQDRGALLGIGIPDSYGFPGSVDSNIGAIDNWGWEASLSSRLYDGDAFAFDLDVNADYTQNEIKDLNDSYTGGLDIGLPYPYLLTGDRVLEGSFDAAGAFANAFGVRMSGLCDFGVSLAPDPTAADAGRWGTLPGGPAVDCNTNRNRQTFAGRGFAPWSFSVSPTVSLLDNQLQIFAMAEGRYGRLSQENGHAWGHIYNNSKISRLENDPLWVVSDRLNGTGGDDFAKALYDADFWKLREVGMRYNLPLSLIERSGASRASLALSVRNIWTIWVAQKEIYGHVVSDPEYGTSSLDGTGNFWETPSLASINATLRVTF